MDAMEAGARADENPVIIAASSNRASDVGTLRDIVAADSAGLRQTGGLDTVNNPSRGAPSVSFGTKPEGRINAGLVGEERRDGSRNMATMDAKELMDSLEATISRVRSVSIQRSYTIQIHTLYTAWWL